MMERSHNGRPTGAWFTAQASVSGLTVGVAECPSLPGCISQGETKADAIANIREAIEGWIETAKAHGMPIADEDFDTQVVCV